MDIMTDISIDAPEPTTVRKARAERKMFREIKRIAEEAIRAKRTNQQVADAVNAVYPDYEMQATDVSGMRSQLRKAGFTLPTSAEAEWLQNFLAAGGQPSSHPENSSENPSS